MYTSSDYIFNVLNFMHYLMRIKIINNKKLNYVINSLTFIDFINFSLIFITTIVK